MSNQTKKLSRRDFLKGATYTSVLSMGGLSSLVFASSKTEASTPNLPTVTLFNQHDKTIRLDPKQPISLEKVNGLIVVKLNKATPSNKQQMITLAAGQRLSFEVDAEMAPLLKNIDDYMVITNEFSAFNNMVPISTYDTLVA